MIVPAFNEAENISLLLKELEKNLSPEDYEVVIVDDGSSDNTFETLQAAKDGTLFPLKIVAHKKNLGKTQAILTGSSMSAGDILVLFDADLQFSPADIPRLVKEITNGADLCVGFKKGYYEKWLVSKIYNSLARAIFRLKVHDINAVKALRREVLSNIHLRKDWHRYIVPLAQEQGYRITEIPVKIEPRRFGKPKYSGKFRILIGFFDLLAVGFQLTFMRKPMLYFGLLGTSSFLFGLIAGLIAIILRIFGHGFRPLLYLVMLLVIIGLLLFGFGFLAETISGIQDRLERLERSKK